MIGVVVIVGGMLLLDAWLEWRQRRAFDRWFREYAATTIRYARPLSAEKVAAYRADMMGPP